MKASEKTQKEKNKKYLKEKQDKKKDLDSTPTTRVNRTNLNSTYKSKKRMVITLFARTIAKKVNLLKTISNRKKIWKTNISLDDLSIGSEIKKSTISEVFKIPKITLL